MNRDWGFGDSTLRPWDAGVRWHLEQSADQAIDWNDDPLTLAFVRDEHLHAANGSAEDAYITRLMRSSYRVAERVVRGSLFPQGWSLVMDRFPVGEIVPPKAPLLEVESIEFLDESGTLQQLTGSPAQFQVSAPSGAEPRRGRILPLAGSSWPSTIEAVDAVTVNFRSGYRLTTDSPQVADVPDDITHARLLIMGELYKQRSESVHAFNQNPAVIRARDLLIGYRVY